MPERITPEVLKKWKENKLNQEGKELAFNGNTRRTELVSSSVIANNPNYTRVEQKDGDLFGNPTVIIEEDSLNQILTHGDNSPCVKIYFQSKDQGEVLKLSLHQETIQGSLFFDELKDTSDEICILLNETTENIQYTYQDKGYIVHCYQKIQEQFVELDVQMIPVKEMLFSRIDGLYETGALSNKKVAIFGLGSGGGTIATELVKAGIMNFELMDPDRLEIVNVVRHVCGLADLGRYKTKAVRDLVIDKNPYATVNTYETKADYEHFELVENMIKSVDLVICATDNRESKQLINRICIENNKTCIYAGAFRRAYGGMVLRVIPHQTLCYECFIEQLSKEEVNNHETPTESIQYSDVVVPIEPGLSTDILPIALMVVKLAILELLKGTNHTMQSLYEDLEAEYYIWLNRREYEYENITPLSQTMDWSIMRWLGIHLEKKEDCAVCSHTVHTYSEDLFESE